MLDQMDVLHALTAHVKERGAINWNNIENAADFIAGYLRDLAGEPLSPIPAPPDGVEP